MRPRFYDNFIFISADSAKKFLFENLVHSIGRKGGNVSLNPLIIEGGTQKGIKDIDMKQKMCIEVIGNGISPELLAVLSEDSDYILYIGRIDIYGKGIDILIKAYKEFYKSFPDIRLVIAGDGRDMNSFKSELMRVPPEIRRNIELLGWVTGSQKKEVLRKALFCVFPSRHEVQSIAALEAMACGKPVIVSDIEEFSFIYQNGAGLPFKTGDAVSLLQALKDIMARSDRYEMGNRGRYMVTEYTWDKISLLYEQFLLMVSGRAN